MPRIYVIIALALLCWMGVILLVQLLWSALT